MSAITVMGIGCMLLVIGGCTGSLQSASGSIENQSNSLLLINKIVKTNHNNAGVDASSSADADSMMAPDDIRCYCNLAKCVATGYMCRTKNTETGGCFSEVSYLQAAATAAGADEKVGGSGTSLPNTLATRHGCIDLLQSDEPNARCENLPATPTSFRRYQGNNRHPPATQKNTDTLLLCCQEDMCNHVDSPDHKKLRPTLTDSDDEDSDSELFAQPSHQHHHSTGESERHAERPNLLLITHSSPPAAPAGFTSNNDAWFRAVTIVVPICGVIIVFMLIWFAMRMLRNDHLDGPASKLSGFNNPAASTHRKCLPHLVDPFDVLAPHGGGGTHAHTGMKREPLLAVKSLAGGGTSSDRKNETQAKINQLMNLEYSLLPQSCNESLVKPTNTELPQAYRNVNLSMNERRGDLGCDEKMYVKESINPVAAGCWAAKETTRLPSYKSDNSCHDKNGDAIKF